eukprot:8547317-Prorocentrum_lima.AAC.1
MGEEDFQDTLWRATLGRGAARGAGQPGPSVEDIVATEAGMASVISARPNNPPKGLIPYPVFDETETYVPLQDPVRPSTMGSVPRH